MKRFLVACALLLTTLPAYGQGTVMPIPLAQWFDNDGAPLVGGGICVYLAGTSTEATTYTTAALSVANANPIPLNSAGRPTSGGVFLTPGTSYKFVLKSATVTTCTPDTGVTIWSVDNVEAVPLSASAVDVTGLVGESITAGQVVYLSTGASGTAGSWYRTDADDVDKSVNAMLVGVAPNAINSGESGLVRISGPVETSGAVTPGANYYASGTVGELTTTAPLNARYIGQAISATELLVGPSQTSYSRLKLLTYSETKTAPAISAGSLTLNLANGTHFAVSLNANITSMTVSNPQTTGLAAAFTLALTADGTPRTIAWPASVKWPYGGTAPTPTSTNGKVDIFTFLTYDGGTTWYAFIGGQNF